MLDRVVKVDALGMGCAAQPLAFGIEPGDQSGIKRLLSGPRFRQRGEFQVSPI